MNIKKAYKSLDMPIYKYIFIYMLSLTLMGVITSLILILLLPDIFSSGIPLVIAIMIPFYCFFAIFFYPIIEFEKRVNKINQEMHLFITRIGVLSTSEISSAAMFKVLSEMREYGELAVEIGKVFDLVEKWGLDLGEGCRIVAQTTPSSLFADFLDRLAHAVETGEDASTFFRSEQQVVMDQFELEYERALFSIETMKEVFVAMVTVASFILVVVALYPLITGKGALSLMVLSVFIFIFVEVVFLFFISAVIPRERIWHETGIKTEVNRKIKKSTTIAIILCIVLGISIIFLYLFTTYIKLDRALIIISIIATPMLIPCYIIVREEEKIKRRENNYAAFIRSLGGSAETGSIGATPALKNLREHNFGPLTDNIKDLYKRLTLGIDSHKSWEYFGAETGSDLTAKFSEMYVEGSRAGGNPREISKIISGNFIRMNGLRKKRYQSSSSLIGILYGISVGVAFVLYISLFLVDYMSDMGREIDMPAGLSKVPLFIFTSYEFTVFTVLLVIVIVIHALISSMMTRVIGGGHKLGAFSHFVAILWICAITAWLSEIMMDYIMD